MIECIGCPGFFEATQFKTWEGWTFHVRRKPLHDVTGVRFRWNPDKGRPEPLPIEIMISGGGNQGLGESADGGPDVGRPTSHWHVPSPGERDRPTISDEDQAMVRPAELSELEVLTHDG